MINFGALVLGLAVLFCPTAHGGTNDYRAAVVEYSPVVGNVTANLVAFEQMIKKAKVDDSVDIIVFPEIGLNGYGPCSEDMLTVVPSPTEGIAPFNNGNYSKALQELSRVANASSIYVVVNVAEKAPCNVDEKCPESGILKYNTNVVFDRKGVVIARYRKYNLFGENGTNTTPEPEISYFDTDFGVRFGTFICFDLMFDKPSLQLVRDKGIQNFVFPTAWFSELPFLTAVQAQQMWSYSLNVNFLGAGYNDPSEGSGGSGIYNGRNGPITMEFPDNTTSTILIANVPKNPAEQSINPKSFPSAFYPKFPIKEEMYLKQEKLDAYVSASLKEIEASPKVCHSEFCCEFFVKNSENETGYRHRALVFDGVRSFDGVATGGVQACALAMCINDTSVGCGVRGFSGANFTEIKISGRFKNKGALSMPSTLTSNYQLLPLKSNEFSYATDCNEAVCNITLTLLKPVGNLQTFGIYSRNFDRDGEPASLPLPSKPNAASALYINAFLVIACIVLIKM